MRNKFSLWPWMVVLCAALLITLTAWIAASGPIELSTALLLVVAGLSLLLVDLLRRQAVQNMALQQTSGALTQARQLAEAPLPDNGELLNHLREFTQAPLQDILNVLDQLETSQLSGPQRSSIRSVRASALHLSDLFSDPRGIALPEPDTLPQAGESSPVTSADSLKLEEPKPGGFDVINTASYGELVAVMSPATLNERLASLFEPPEGSVHALVACLSEGNAARIVVAAQNLKGSALSLGFQALGRTSAQIERLAQEDNSVLRRELGKQLLADMARTQQAVKELAEV